MVENGRQNTPPLIILEYWVILEGLSWGTFTTRIEHFFIYAYKFHRHSLIYWQN